MKKEVYGIGQHPRSLQNLRPHIPQIHDEPKTARINTALTPTGKEGLVKLATEYGLSFAELLEQIGRGNFVLVRKNNLRTKEP